MSEDDDVQIIEASVEEKAESKKGLGNKLYKSNDFIEAIKRYTEAIGKSQFIHFLLVYTFDDSSVVTLCVS